MPISPIVCFSCGKYVSEYANSWRDHWETVKNLSVPEQEAANIKFFDNNGLTRYCCRNVLANSPNILEILKRKKKEKK